MSQDIKPIAVFLHPYLRSAIGGRSFYKFFMGHMILTKLKGLVNKTLKMICKLSFGSMIPKKQTIMTALIWYLDPFLAMVPLS